MNQGDKEKKNDDFDGFQAAIAILFVFVSLPASILYFLGNHLAERAEVWVLLKSNAQRIRVSSLIAVSLLVLSTIPLIKLAITSNNLIRILILLYFWVTTFPLGLLALKTKFVSIYKKIHDGNYDPRKAGLIKTALEIADYLYAQERHQKVGIPVKTKTGVRPIGHVAKLDFLGKVHKKLNRHMSFDLEDVTEQNHAVFPLSISSPQHSLVIAETGAGKTVLLSRMALSALSSDWRVVILDFKGSINEATLYCSLPKMVRDDSISFAFPQQPINLFWGDTKEVAARLVGFLPQMPTGNATYYWARQATAITAVIERTHSSLLPPQSFPELLHRIRNAGQFAVDPDDRNMLLAKEHGRLVCEDIAGVLGTYFQHLRGDDIGGLPGGFSFTSDWDLLFYSFNGMDVNQVNLGSSVITDFSHWIGSKNRLLGDKRPVLLIVDEASALMLVNGSPSLVSLYQKARSLGCAVVVASQTLSSLDKHGLELLNSGCIRYIGRTSIPDEIISASGTRSVVEVAHQFQDEMGYSGTQTFREQESFLISPNLVRRMPNLCWVATAKGKKTSIYVPWIESSKAN